MKYPLIYLLAFVIASCAGNNTNSEEREAENSSKLKALEDSIMAIHDEVMPEIGRLRSLQKSLDTLTRDSLHQDNIDSVLSELKYAQTSMMEWMREYEPVTEKPITDSLRRYYRKQKKLIEEVNTSIKSSINQAEQIINENESDK